MPKRKATLEREARERLGEQLRDVVLRFRIYDNQYHDNPGWSEITDYSRRTWTAVAQALQDAGWKPPVEAAR